MEWDSYISRKWSKIPASSASSLPGYTFRNMHIFRDMKIVSAFLICLTFLIGCQTTTTTTAATSTFTNPLISSGADPWVEYYNGMYYITHSTGRDLKLYRSKSVSDLAKAESK